jgi:hypothetical protein
MRRWTMEKGSFQGYAASLERTMQTMHLDLEEALYQLQELCPLITPGRNVPVEIVTDIRQTYKRIQEQLIKIRGVRQLLEGKYRQCYHRDSHREKEMTEFAFLAKSLYSKFECTLQEIEAKGKLRDREEQLGWDLPRMPSPWFQSKGNQIMLLRNIKDLWELDYTTQFGLEREQRREIIRNGMRSISLFVMSGEAPLIHHLQRHMRLREYDIKELSSINQCRGALIHLKEISLLDVERVIRRFTGSIGFSKVKCLLLRIQSQKDLEKEMMGSIENILRETEPGVVRTVSI